jgi:hypothetical protein
MLPELSITRTRSTFFTLICPALNSCENWEDPEVVLVLVVEVLVVGPVVEVLGVGPVVEVLGVGPVVEVLGVGPVVEVLGVPVDPPVLPPFPTQVLPTQIWSGRVTDLILKS